MSPEPYALGDGLLQIVPICHYKVEFARQVRRAIQHFSPDKVALELAGPLREPYERAVARFPYLSILALGAGLGEEGRRAAEELKLSPEDLEALQGEAAITLLPVEPTDPFAEAVRTARELGKSVHFVDLAVGFYPSVPEGVPDSTSLASIGLQKFYEEYEAARDRSLDPPEDRRREEHMAAELRRLTSDGSRVLLVCGMAHARGVLEAFSGQPNLHEGAVTPQVTVCEPDLPTVRAMSFEMPLVMALYELSRGGPGPDHAWQELEPEEPEPPPPPPPSRLESITSGQALGALEMLLGMKPSNPVPEEPITPDVLRRVAKYLSQLQDPRLSLSNLDIPPGLEFMAPHGARGPSAPVKVFKFKQVSDRRPQLLDHYARINGDSRTPDGTPDRQRILLHLCRTAAEFHQENTGEKLADWQFQVLFQFVRNYAALKGMLLPGTYELLMGARGVADDNYSYEVWDLATFYPWSDPSGSVETIRIDPEQMSIGGRQFKQWTFHRRFPRLRQMRAPVAGRQQEGTPGEWGEQLDTGRICSYPPEDIVIEDYGRYLQRKAITVLSEERARVEPFSTSLLDGVDMRETIRNWAEKHAIYVRETQRVKGGAGSVVVIFEDDLPDQRFPWKMTWHGEHAQESDMAFYATPAQAKVVGPGIARCEYGGLMLTYPPRRLNDVWSDPMYAAAQTKAEVLLMAAIDYCVEKHVVFVAAKPPRSFFRTFASRLGKKVVYIPLGQLSPVSLKRIRVFHVLSGHRLRQIAKDYIW